MPKVYENDKPIFPLEVGKSYITREGSNTGPLESHDNSPYVFWSSALNMSYTSTGFAYSSHVPCESDIIKPADSAKTSPSPAPAPIPPLQLAEGKYYRRATGEVFGPMAALVGDIYPFEAQGIKFTASGRFSVWEPKPLLDLIEEVEPSMLARIEGGEDLETRDGRPVQIYATNAVGSHPILGMVGPDWFATCWNQFGANVSGNNALDLVPSRKSIKANLYRNLKTHRYGIFMQDDVPDLLTWELLSEHEIPIPPRKEG